MKQVPSGKYTIAWFKLAECVSRGEKERALGVYRLLSHSLDDSALVCQLEGDIFLSFNDKQQAVTNYALMGGEGRQYALPIPPEWLYPPPGLPPPPVSGKEG